MLTRSLYRFAGLGSGFQEFPKHSVKFVFSDLHAGMLTYWVFGGAGRIRTPGTCASTFLAIISSPALGHSATAPLNWRRGRDSNP